MSQKDHVKIAQAINSSYKNLCSCDCSYETFSDVVRNIASKLAEDNPRFSNEVFEKACYSED